MSRSFVLAVVVAVVLGMLVPSIHAVGNLKVDNIFASAGPLITVNRLSTSTCLVTSIRQRAHEQVYRIATYLTSCVLLYATTTRCGYGFAVLDRHRAGGAQRVRCKRSSIEH